MILTDIARLLTLECVERTSLQEKQLEHSVAPQIISPQMYNGRMYVHTYDHVTYWTPEMCMATSIFRPLCQCVLYNLIPS